jgi:hypothetical protein
VQLGAGDLLGGLVYGSAPGALAVLGVTAPVAALMNANRGPLHSRFVAAQNGEVVAGYDRLKKMQLQVNANPVLPRRRRIRRALPRGELGYQNVDVPDSKTGRALRPLVRVRHRDAPGLRPARGCRARRAGPVPQHANQPGCENDGFVTKHSYGYRVRGQLSYSNVANVASP